MMSISKLESARKYGKAGTTPRRLTVAGFLAQLGKKHKNTKGTPPLGWHIYTSHYIDPFINKRLR